MTAIDDSEEQRRERKRLKRLKKDQKRQLKEQSGGESENIEKKRSSDSSDSTGKKSKKHKSAEPTTQPTINPTADNQTAQKWYADNDIVVKDPVESAGNDGWKPILQFDETGLSADILHACSTFKQPTPIQSACWPIVLSKRDCIGIAETGSGKTLAFGIPALAYLNSLDQPLSKQPKVLVLAPTRELAMQISEQFTAACKQMSSLRSLCIYGGVPKDEQRKQLKKGVQIVIGCPGRLLDLMDEGCCDLSKIGFVVLDEADRMLDMGFEREVRRILAATGAQKQTVMFSATWPQSIVQLANEFLSKPVKVTVGSPDLGANRNITQLVEVCDPREKDQKLLQLLERYHSTRQNRVLVFALYKKEASRVHQMLLRKGYNCAAIHGDMNQPERTRNFNQFKSGQVPLLIATDVAARGLDIPNVEYVINYTFSLTIEDYTHRIGRTGRAGKKGISHTLFTVHDKARAGELINLLKQTNQKVPADLLQFGTTVKKKEHSAYGAFFKDIDESGTKATKITFDSDDE